MLYIMYIQVDVFCISVRSKCLTKYRTPVKYNSAWLVYQHTQSTTGLVE